MLWAFVYLALRRVLGLLVLRGRSQRSKDAELVVRRHDVQILRRQVRLWRAQTRSCWRPAVLYRVSERYRGQSEAGERLGWLRRPCAERRGSHGK